MFFRKRITITLVLVLALAFTGVVTVSASTGTQDPLPRQQAETTAWLGIRITEADGAVLIVQVVLNSPAAEAGLQRGDIIVAVDGIEIESVDMLIETIQTYAPGDVIEVDILRGNKEETVSATLVETPVPIEGPSGAHITGRMNVLGINAEITEAGLLIVDIAPDSPFAESDLLPGDLITAINGESTAGEFFPGMALGAIRFGDAVTFDVVREGKELQIEVEVASAHVEMAPSGPVIQVQPVRPTQLGVQFQTITPEVAAEKALPVSEGALILEVFEGTPAAKAELVAGDIVLAVEGDVVDQERTLVDRLNAFEEGDMVMLLVLREGQEIEVEITLGPRGAGIRGNADIQIIPMPDMKWPSQPGQQRFFHFMPNMPHMMPCQHGFFGFEMRPGRGNHFHGGEHSEMHPGMGERFFGGEHFEMFPGMGERFFGGEFFEMHPFMGEFFFGEGSFWGQEGTMPHFEQGAPEPAPESEGPSA